MTQATAAPTTPTIVSGCLAEFDARVARLGIPQLVTFYDAVFSSLEAFGPHLSNGLVRAGDSENVMLSFEDGIIKCADAIIEVLRMRRPEDANNQSLRAGALIKHELRFGASAGRITALAAALAIEGLN